MKLDNFPETMKARIRKILDKKEIWPYPSRLCGDHKWYERALECERQGMNRFCGLEIFRKSLTVFQCNFKVTNDGLITHVTVRPGSHSDGYSRRATVLWVKMVSFKQLLV